MKRDVIIGNAGGGKSRLARITAAAHDLPLVELDKMLWLPGWVARAPGEFNAEHQAILARPRWLIDGFGPWSSVQARLTAADTVIFVDLPLWRHFWWASKRQIKSLVIPRPDGPEGCPMLPVTLRLYRMMWQLHRETRPQLLHALKTRRPSQRLIHIRSPRDWADFAQDPVAALDGLQG